MRMKNTSCAFSIAVLVLLFHTRCITPAVAEEASSRWQNDDLSFGATTVVASRNVFRGAERSGAAWQAGLDGALYGWRGHLWYSDPFKSDEPGEFRSSLGYVWALTKTVTVEASGTHFWYIDGYVKGAASHSFESDLRLNWDIGGGLRFGLETSYDIRLRSLGIEVSTSYDIALKSWGAFLECRLYGGNLDGKDVLPDTTSETTRDAYTYWGAEVRLPYRIGAHTTIVAEVHVVETLGQNSAWSPLREGSGTRAWFALEASYGF